MKRLILSVIGVLCLSYIAVSIAHADNTSRRKEMSGVITEDGDLTVTGNLHLFKYQDWKLYASTPSVPAANHAKFWVDSVNHRTCTEYDDSSIACLGTGTSIIISSVGVTTQLAVADREDYIVGTPSGNYTGSTTVFNLTNAYTVSGHTLYVMVNGLGQTSGASFDYIETSSRTVTFNNALLTGQRVSFWFTQPTLGAAVGGGGGGGSGTVNSGTFPRLAYYSATGTTISDIGVAGTGDSASSGVTTYADVLTSSGTSVAPIFRPPQLVASLRLASQSTALSSATLYTTPNDGIRHLYRITAYMVCRSSGTAGTLRFGMGWTDATGTRRDNTTGTTYDVPHENFGITGSGGNTVYTATTGANNAPTLTLTAGQGNYAAMSWTIIASPATTITYGVPVTGAAITGTPQYDVAYSVEMLN